MTGQIQSSAKWYLSEPLDLSWRSQAACGGRSDLPWTSNVTPDQYDFWDMRELCEQCPVWRQCAGFGLMQEGGFYAGVWVPWKSTDGNTRGRDERFEAAHGLLRELAVADSNGGGLNTPTRRRRRELSLSSQRAVAPPVATSPGSALAKRGKGLP